MEENFPQSKTVMLKTEGPIECQTGWLKKTHYDVDSEFQRQRQNLSCFREEKFLIPNKGQKLEWHGPSHHPHSVCKNVFLGYLENSFNYFKPRISCPRISFKSKSK